MVSSWKRMDKRMRAKGVDLRKHSENTTTPKKTLASSAHQSSSSEKLARSISINDLPEAEKQKIAQLAEKVLELNNQVLHLSRHVEQERVRHAEEIKSIHATIEGQISIIEDRLKLKDGTITKLENKEQMITAMLALYQAKLKNMADICRLAGDNEEYNKKKLTQMQADLDHFHIITQNQKKLIESFDETKQQMEERVKSIESRHAKRIKTLEDMVSEETDRRLRAEKLSLQQGSENIMLKAEVQQLQYQLQQMRALHTSSLEQEVLIPHLRRAATAAAAAPVAQPPVEASRPAAVPTPVVATASFSSSIGKHPLDTKEDTNPFKKYGPYDEYSLLFNNSQGDESGVQSPAGKTTFLTSPQPTPASTKVPFAMDAAVSLPSRQIISQAEDLLRRSRNMQLLSSTEGVQAVTTATTTATAPAPAPAPATAPSLAFPGVSGSTTAYSVAAPPSLPPLKSMDTEPMLAVSQRTTSQGVPLVATNSSSAAVQTMASNIVPPMAPSAGAPAFYPRDSRDSLISSVGRPADHVEFDSGDEESFGEDDDEEDDDEEEDGEEEDGEEDEEEDGVETANAQPTVATKAVASTTPQQHRRRQQAHTHDPQVTTAVSSASATSLDVRQASLANRDHRPTTVPIEQPPAVPAAATKPFYPMRPLSASGTSSTSTSRKSDQAQAQAQGDPAALSIPATTTATTTKKKKKTTTTATKTKKAAKETSSKNDTTGGIALVSTSYEDSRQQGGTSPVNKPLLSQGPTELSAAIGRVSKVKKVKRSKPSTKKDTANANGVSVSFMSHESKDAVALLQEKPSLLVSSTESITYLPRPPPRSAQKQQRQQQHEQKPSGVTTSPPSSSGINGASHVNSNNNVGQPSKKKPSGSKVSSSHLDLPFDRPTTVTGKVGNNLHYAVPPRLNQPSTIDDHHYHHHHQHQPQHQKHSSSSLTTTSRPRPAARSSINDKFDASLFDLVDELERGPSSRNTTSSYHYDDDDDADADDGGV